MLGGRDPQLDGDTHTCTCAHAHAHVHVWTVSPCSAQQARLSSPERQRVPPRMLKLRPYPVHAPTGRWNASLEAETADPKQQHSNTPHPPFWHAETKHIRDSNPVQPSRRDSELSRFGASEEAGGRADHTNARHYECYDTRTMSSRGSCAANWLDLSYVLWSSGDHCQRPRVAAI